MNWFFFNQAKGRWQSLSGWLTPDNQFCSIIVCTALVGPQSPLMNWFFCNQAKGRWQSLSGWLTPDNQFCSIIVCTALVGPQASHWLHDLPILEPNLSTYFIIFGSSKGQIVQIQISHASHVLYQISLWVPTTPLRIKCLGLPWLSCIHGQVLSILKKVLSSDFYFFSIL